VRRGFAITFFVASAVVSNARAEERPKVAVVVTGKVLAKDAEALALNVSKILAERPELSLIADDRAAWIFRSTKPPAPKRSRKNLEAARRNLQEALEQLNSFDLANAVKSVTKARTALTGYIGAKAAFEVDRDRLHLAVAIAHAQRDQQRLVAALNEYAIRYPNEPPPHGLWPPDVVNTLKSITIAPTVLNVKSDPPALVYVDGREVGMSPIRLGALPAGEHRVEIQLPGYWSVDQVLETTAAREAILEAKLAPNLSSALRKASPKKTLDPAIEKRIRELAPELGILILAAMEDGKLHLRRIDLAAGSVPRGAADTVRGDTAPESVRFLLAQLFESPSVPGDGVRVPLWAWIGAGSGVVAIGAGVTMRMLAVGTEHEFNARLGALTQSEAYELRDRSSSQATGGAVLMGIGVAAIAGVASWVALDVL
jgi:hypothetical protein